MTGVHPTTTGTYLCLYLWGVTFYTYIYSLLSQATPTNQSWESLPRQETATSPFLYVTWHVQVSFASAIFTKNHTENWPFVIKIKRKTSRHYDVAPKRPWLWFAGKEEDCQYKSITEYIYPESIQCVFQRNLPPPPRKEKKILLLTVYCRNTANYKLEYRLYIVQYPILPYKNFKWEISET